MALELDKNGADILVSVKCQYCDNKMWCTREYHKSTEHWEYKCNNHHVSWLSVKEIEEYAI